MKDNLMDEFKMIFINYSFVSFERKLRGTDERYKAEFFDKIKYFYESFDLSIQEFKSLILAYQTYYAHVLCSNNYDEFNKMNSVFDGKNIST